jgi:hypothetical protein
MAGCSQPTLTLSRDADFRPDFSTPEPPTR